MVDLDWLIGTWRGQAKNQELTISFVCEKNGPFIVADFTATAAGKTVLAPDTPNLDRAAYLRARLNGY